MVQRFRGAESAKERVYRAEIPHTQTFGGQADRVKLIQRPGARYGMQLPVRSLFLDLVVLHESNSPKTPEMRGLR